MNAKTYEGTALHYVLVTPEGFAADGSWPLVVLLHGFGANMYDLAGLADEAAPAGYAYAFPNAPYEVQLGPGMVGSSWATGHPGMAPPPEGAPDVDALLDGFMTDVRQETGAAPGRIVLGGFSQGGGLTLRYGLPRPELFAGLAVLSGFFRDQDSVTLPAARDQRVFVAHGTVDNVVPIAGGRANRDFLQANGYAPEYHEYEIAHQISQEELGDLTAWLSATLPPHA